MRPTDVCHPNDLRAPASRTFPASSRDFRRVDTPQGLRPCVVVPGDQTVHAVRTASADWTLTQHRRYSRSRVCLVRSASRLPGHERGRFLPTARRSNRASDIPVASLAFIPTRASPSCVPLRASSCWACARSVVMGELPRLLSTPIRDDRCFPQPEMPSLGKDPS